MKKVIVALLVTGSCLAGDALNRIPQNPVQPQQPVLAVMMMRAVLDGRVEVLAHKRDKLSYKNYNQKQRIVPKNQKFPKQRMYNIQQSR